MQGLSLINCKEPLQGAMLEKMQDLRVLILQNIAIKGFCSKALNQLQFLYWGKTQVSREVRLPFQIGKLRKLEMMILCAHEIDLLMKVDFDCCFIFISCHSCEIAARNFTTLIVAEIISLSDAVPSSSEGSDHNWVQQHGGTTRDSACAVSLSGASSCQLQPSPRPDSFIWQFENAVPLSVGELSQHPLPTKMYRGSFKPS